MMFDGETGNVGVDRCTHFSTYNFIQNRHKYTLYSEDLILYPNRSSLLKKEKKQKKQKKKVNTVYNNSTY